MAPYFNPQTKADQELLPSAIRGDPELGRVAALAEADVIAYFTASPPYANYTVRETLAEDGVTDVEVKGEDVSTSASGPQLRVYLRGYKADADHADVDPKFKIAMRRTVAEVIAWRIARERRELAVTSSSDGSGKSRSYAGNAQDQFPPEWTRWLQPFKSDEPLWAFG